MLLLSLKNFNDCCEISCCKVRFIRTVSETQFPNECNYISGKGSGNKDLPSLPNPNFLISQYNFWKHCKN